MSYGNKTPMYTYTTSTTEVPINNVVKPGIGFVQGQVYTVTPPITLTVGELPMVKHIVGDGKSTSFVFQIAEGTYPNVRAYNRTFVKEEETTQIAKRNIEINKPLSIDYEISRTQLVVFFSKAPDRNAALIVIG